MRDSMHTFVAIVLIAGVICFTPQVPRPPQAPAAEDAGNVQFAITRRLQECVTAIVTAPLDAIKAIY